jgi:hypothetical protein
MLPNPTDLRDAGSRMLFDRSLDGGRATDDARHVSCGAG